MHALFAWYSIGWQENRFNRLRTHERTLTRDLREAIDEHHADVIFLSECGEIGIGFPGDRWLALLRRCVGPGFTIVHQSHYTSIVRFATVDVEEGPTLVGPLTRHPEHDYRTCQHLRVAMKGSAAKPIDLFNVNSPASKKHPLNTTRRAEIFQWFANNAGSRALIGGDLNSSRHNLDAAFGRLPDIHYCYEEDHRLGDLVVAKGVPAESTACNIESTSDAHRMCIVSVPLGTPPPSLSQPSGSAEKPTSEAHGSAGKPTIVAPRSAEKLADPAEPSSRVCTFAMLHRLERAIEPKSLTPSAHPRLIPSDPHERQ